MAYDAALADRVRELLDTQELLPRESVVEKRMFGGLAFVVEEHLAVVVSHEGGLMLRVDPAEEALLRARPHVGDVVMRQRPVRGWVRVEEAGCLDDDDLRDWVLRGVDRAQHLDEVRTAGA